MKFIYILLFISLAAQNAYGIHTAQPENTKPDTRRIDKLLAHSRQLIRDNDERAFGELSAIKELIARTGYTDKIGEYCRHVFELYTLKGRYDEAGKELNFLYEKYADKLSAQQQIQIEILQLRLKLQEDNYQEIIEKATHLLPEAREPDELGWLHYLKARSYNETGNYEASSRDYLEALQLFKKTGNKEGLAGVYAGLGNLQNNMGKAGKALDSYQISLKNAEQSGYVSTIMDSYSMLGLGYTVSKNYGEALSSYHKALELARQYGNNYNIARNLNNIGNIYKLMENYPEAIKANEASLEICMENHIDYGIITNYLNIAHLNCLQQNYTAAIEKLQEAENHLDGKSFPAEKAEVERIYYLAYKGLGENDKALKYHEQFYEQRTKLIDEKTRKAVEELNIKYESALKDKEIETRKIQNKQLALVLGFVLIVTTLGIFFLVYRNRSLRNLYRRNVELMHNLNAQSRPEGKEIPSGEETPAGSENLKAIFVSIRNLFENEKIYTNPALSLTDVARQAKSNEKYVSQAISMYARMNFSNYVNFYRINLAKNMLYESSGTSIKEIMETCGFNSKTPFYNAFHKFTGMTPLQFKEMARSEKYKKPEEE